WPLTEKTAKPLLLLAGKPLISWIIEDLPQHLEVIVSTNAVFAKDFERWREENFPERQIEIFVEDAFSESGKMGALFATSCVIQELKIAKDILLLAGDNYFGFSLPEFLENFQKFPNDALLAAYDIRETQRAKSFGVIVPQAGTEKIVKVFQEKPEQPLSTLVSTGCFVIPQKLLPSLSSFAATSRDDLGKVFEHFLEQDKTIRYFSFIKEWFDIGSFSAYLAASKLLLKEKIVQEKAVEVSPDAQLSGSIFLGANTKIGRNVTLENAIIFPDCRLENCVIRNSVLGKGTVISGVDLEGKVIREESVLMR